MYTLPSLGYDDAALEPHIDQKTMNIHHTKHHQTYIDKLNAGLSVHPVEHNSLEELVSKTLSLDSAIQGIVRNHGGGHINHSMFWELLSPNHTEIGEKTSLLLTQTYGSIDQFKETFTNKALALFGSGWTRLVVNEQGATDIVNYPNQDNPIMFGLKPILGIDLWEHAYYLQNQNRRNEYIIKRWNVVNWDQVEKNLQK